MSGAKRGSTRRASRKTPPAPLQLATSGSLPGTARPPLNQMSCGPGLAGRAARFVRKKARERAYLDRRAASHIYTATDKAYEADQLLEADLLDMLNEFERFVALMEP